MSKDNLIFGWRRNPLGQWQITYTMPPPPIITMNTNLLTLVKEHGHAPPPDTYTAAEIEALRVKMSASHRALNEAEDRYGPILRQARHEADMATEDYLDAYRNQEEEQAS